MTISIARAGEDPDHPGCRAHEARPPTRSGIAATQLSSSSAACVTARDAQIANSRQGPPGRELFHRQFFRPRGGIDAGFFQQALRRPAAFRLWRSILRRWPKAAAVIVSRSCQVRRRHRLGQRLQPHDGRGDRRRRHKGAAVDIEQDFGLACASPPAPTAGHNVRCRAWR